MEQPCCSAHANIRGKGRRIKPKFEIIANSVRVILPNVLYKKEIKLLEKEQEFVNLLNKNEFLAAKDISVALVPCVI